MEPEEFIAKWRDNTRRERAASQHHFLELCEVLEVPKPGDPGFPPDDYDFDKSTERSSGRSGFADVWKKGCFAWEYKGDLKSLVAAYAQVKDYSPALDNPPLLIVSDMSEIRIHTNFTNTPSVTHVIKLPDLVSVEARRNLRHAFLDPEKLRPEETPETVTADAAASVGALATKLRADGYDPRRVAHFLNKLVFCMFAEDIGLLPGYLFTEVMEECSKKSELFISMVTNLFRAMKEENGLFGSTVVPWFNGGLFDDDDVLPLGFYEINDLLAAAQLDWSSVEPSVFGTLFEKGLNPARRKEMANLFDARADAIETSVSRDLFDSRSDKGVGIHYTDVDKIMKIVEPVVLRPLREEWEGTKKKIETLRVKKQQAKSDGAQTRAENEVGDAWYAFRERLGKYRVLDPACGSGNFLYLSLIHLKDFDLSVIREGHEIGLPQDDQRITPDAVMGIEINPYAAELAQVTIWIGEIQWQLQNGFGVNRRPILEALPNIQCRDALINPNGSIAEWPSADAIIGNPPFLGAKRLLSGLGEDYVYKLRSAYEGRVANFSDLVCYWVARGYQAIQNSNSSVVGLVTTNSISKGTNQRVLEPIADELEIFEAWSDEPWVIDGAAVRISIVSFCSKINFLAKEKHLDGALVGNIFADLTGAKGAEADLTRAERIAENTGASFIGVQKNGPFDIDGNTAREWLLLPANPNGRHNKDVLRPLISGMDITRRPRDRWIIDFGASMDEMAASLFETPFEHVLTHVKPQREVIRREIRRRYWWRHGEAMPAMRRAVSSLSRYIVTSLTAKHRVFQWAYPAHLADSTTVIIAREDDTIFGILHSKFHEMWALRLGTSLEDRPRYTPSTTFETFPFPDGLTPNIPVSENAGDRRAKSIADAARELNELRENWLNPEDLIERALEVVEGYPDRILPKNETAEKELKKRTLTNLYNQRPAWLDNAHRKLDEAVAAAYGWPADLSDDEILKRLLELNLERAAKQENDTSVKSGD